MIFIGNPESVYHLTQPNIPATCAALTEKINSFQQMDLEFPQSELPSLKGVQGFFWSPDLMANHYKVPMQEASLDPRLNRDLLLKLFFERFTPCSLGHCPLERCCSRLVIPQTEIDPRYLTYDTARAQFNSVLSAVVIPVVSETIPKVKVKPWRKQDSTGLGNSANSWLGWAV